jgi:hypothetical protein
MERRLKMKLNKKTIYHVKTKELYDAIMKDAEKQGLKSWHGCKPNELDWWDGHKEDTCIRIDEDGELNYGSTEYYKTNYLDHEHKDYKDTPEVYSIFGGLCVDAPDFSTAYDVIKDYIQNRGAIPIRNAVYTIRVEDDATTVITPEGKMATAKCHPDDDFDVVEGFRVALEKIKESERKLTKEEHDILYALKLLNCSTFEVTDYEQIIGFNNNGNDVEIDTTDKDVFSWLKPYKEFNVKELLEKYA